MRLSDWSAILVVIPTVLFVQTNGDFPSGAHQAVRCMLAHNSPEDCASLPKVIVPSYLLQEYNNGPSSLHEALNRNTLKQLSEEQVSNIPLSLLYLVPRARLADLNANQLRAILQKHSGDKSLVHQVAACLHHGNSISKFIEKMNFSLPEESLQILAESVAVKDLTREFLKLPFIEKEPLLAYLRPAVLDSVHTSTLYSLLIVLQLTEPTLPKKSAFYFLTEAAVKHGVPLSKIYGFVLGLSPDQLLNESLSFVLSVSDFRLDLSILQARALFERSFKDQSLGSSHFIDSKPLLYKLSPELLQKFPHNVQKYDVNYLEQIASIPFPTACQITEYVKADCILTRKLPEDEDKFWDINIRHLGKWVYTLPLSALEGYKTSALTTAVLKTLESSAISPMQAYYLTGKGEALDVMTPNSVLELETFLHALPASQLVNRKLGEISNHVKLHLVSKLPANNLARTLSLINKISSSIGDTANVATDDNAGDSLTLEELLGNSDVNQIMTLVSPKDLDLSAEPILKFFGQNRIRNMYGQTIEQLPQQILAALLHHDRLNNPGEWRWSRFLETSQVNHLLVGGLTCQHIEEMDTGLFIPIMSHYNAVRKKSFPKNLQHCCLQKLINHLKLKMTLTQTDPDLGLISLLEPVEIESLGGYVLVHIPLDAMRVSPYLGHILSKIGQLSSTELMLSADIGRLKVIAELAVDKEGNVDTYLVRNLVWFLPPNASTPDLRRMLEAQLVDSTICLPAEDRQLIATRLISVFGSPEHWTAGVLATLQDLLIVFSDEELSKVPQSSWTKAADSFTSHYNDLVDWIETSAFYKVCANILGKSEENDYKNAIGRYIRWRLKAAQRLLGTVVPISQPEVYKPDYVDYMNQVEESKQPLDVFNPSVEMETATEEADESEYEDEEDEETKTEDTTVLPKESETESSPTMETKTEKSVTEETKTEKSTTEETKTEKSTTKETKTEKPTMEETKTEKSTTEETTTEKPTMEETKTEKSTTEETKTEKPTMEETKTEKSTTEETKIEESTTEEANIAKSTSIGSADEEITEISTIKEYSVTEKNAAYQNVPEDVVTQNSIQKIISTKQETSENFTTEASFTGKAEGSKILILNTPTQNFTNLNITSTSVKYNHDSRGENVTDKISESSYENTTDFENVVPCINSVNKEDCQNHTTVSPNKPNKMSVNEIPHGKNDTASQKFTKPRPTNSNKNSSFSFENQSNYSSSQNSSIIPSKVSLNQSDNQTTTEKPVVTTTSTVIPTVSDSLFDKTSKIPPPSQTMHNGSITESSSSSTFMTDKNSTANFQNPKKNFTSGENSQNRTTVITTAPKHQSSDEDYQSDEAEEEPILDDDFKNKNDTILINPSNRKERSVSDDSSDIELSCNAIKMVGNLAELTLTTADLSEMSASEIADCRMEFGAMNLSEAIQKIIWKRMENDLKLDGIHLLGRLLRVVSVADLWDINFRASQPWTLETIHAIIQYNNNTMLMKKLMQEVNKYNSEFSVDLLAVLGPAVCSLEPDSLRALSVIGLDLGPSCPSCLPYLAQRATEELGSVKSWTPHFVHSLQTIAAGLDLDSWRLLAESYLKPLAGLQPSAAKCLNTSHLEVLSADQIRMIPAVTLLSLFEHQLAVLNSDQMEAVRNITHPAVVEKITPTNRVYVARIPTPTGNSNKVFPSVVIMSLISILHFPNLFNI